MDRLREIFKGTPIEKELSKITKYKNCPHAKTDVQHLEDSFDWSASPQHYYFWSIVKNDLLRGVYPS